MSVLLFSTYQCLELSNDNRHTPQTFRQASMIGIHPSTWIITLLIFDEIAMRTIPLPLPKRYHARYAIILRRRSRNWPNFSKLLMTIPRGYLEKSWKLPESALCDNARFNYISECIVNLLHFYDQELILRLI